MRDCDNWSAKNGAYYSNTIRAVLGNAATKLLTPAMCRSMGIDIPNFPVDVLVELYKHGDDYLLRIVNPCGFAEHLGFKDGISAVDSLRGRGGKETRASAVAQWLTTVKGMAFAFTELDADLLTEMNTQTKSQMLNDPNRVIHLLYIGDGPKPSPKLTKAQVYNQFTGTDDEGGGYSQRVKDHEDAIRAKMAASYHVTKDTPKKSLLAVSNSKAEVGRMVGSNHTTVGDALEKEGEKRIGRTDYLISPNKAKACHPLGLTSLGKRLLPYDGKGNRLKKDEEEERNENLELSDGSRPRRRRRKCRGKY